MNICVFAGMAAQQAMPSSDAIETKMKEILSSPEFEVKEDYLMKVLLEWVEGILGSLFDHAGPVDVTARIVFLITVVLLGGLIVFAVFWISKMVGRNYYTAKKSKETIMGPITVEQVYARGEAAAQQGDYISGIRWLFLYLLLTLHHRAYLFLDDSKTNRQYYHELMKSQYPHLTAFKTLVMQFDRICYGKQGVEEKDYLRFLGAVNGLCEGEGEHEKK